MRWREGVVKYVPMPTHNSYPIEQGDLLWKHSDGKVYPASACTTVLGDAGTAAQNRQQFASRFAGVADRKVGLQSGETVFNLPGTYNPGYILVATSGVFAFPVASTSFVSGDLVGVYNDATDSSNQVVAKVTAVDEAIGTAKVPVAALGAAVTEVLVDIKSAMMRESLSGNV